MRNIIHTFRRTGGQTSGRTLSFHFQGRQLEAVQRTSQGNRDFIVSIKKQLPAKDMQINLYLLKYVLYIVCTGCSGKIVFFHISLQPHPRLHRCKRSSKLSTQFECTVTPIGWLFLCNQQQPSTGEGVVANFRDSLEKKHNI